MNTVDPSKFEKKITVTGASLWQEHRDDPEQPGSITSVDMLGHKGMEASDGYHTFSELYDHRITLFIALCRISKDRGPSGWWSQVWRSKRHSDGELCFGTGSQFVLGIGKADGTQITYHIPIERWDETGFAETLEVAPEWDKHSSSDVLDRLKSLERLQPRRR
jgi:hypothetical protein